MLPGLLSIDPMTPPLLLFLFRAPLGPPKLRMLTGLVGLNEEAPPGPTRAGLSMYGKRGEAHEAPEKRRENIYIGSLLMLPQRHGAAGCWISGQLVVSVVRFRV
jgi:hypothetical protein